MPLIEPRVLTGKGLAEATKTALANTLNPDVMLDKVINVKINYEHFKVDDKYMTGEWKAGSIIIRSDMFNIEFIQCSRGTHSQTACYG